MGAGTSRCGSGIQCGVDAELFPGNSGRTGGGGIYGRRESLEYPGEDLYSSFQGQYSHDLSVRPGLSLEFLV